MRVSSWSSRRRAAIPAAERAGVSDVRLLESGAFAMTLLVLTDVHKNFASRTILDGASLQIDPGEKLGLVGPNGSGKTTLMNLLIGLIRPTQGRLHVLGLTPEDPEAFFRRVGYCTQFDSFPPGVTGRGFVHDTLRLHGFTRREADALTEEALTRAGMTEAADRRVAGYSKGMRQRIRLAQAIAHRPLVLVLDEPLNGLDPMARAETIALFQALGREGLHVILSSHILHEVDRISDRVVLLSNGYVVAQGEIHGVRTEVTDTHPLQVLVRCADPGLLAARVFAHDHVVEAKRQADGRGLLVRTRNADALYGLIGRLVVEEGLEVDTVAPADDDVHSVYQYLIGMESE